MHILSWNGSEAKIMSGDTLFTSYEKPKLSFEYIALFYEEPTDLDFYVDADSEKQTLSEEQKQEIIKWCDSFEEEHDYLVAVVNEDGIYTHMEYKKTAENEGLSWVFLDEPDTDNGIWRLTKDKTWEQIYAAFDESGQPYYWPRSIDPYVLYMTQDEYGRLGDRPTMAHTLNFTTMEWVDARNLDRLKFHAKSDVWGYFQYWRAHNVEGRISLFETSTWATQKSEAEAWLKNHSAHTPFIDGMLQELPDVEKEELCQRIAKHYNDEHLAEIGRMHGKMYSYIYAIENAKTIAEVDKIMIELKQFTGGKTVLNVNSEYKPALKSYGDDVIVVEDARETFYHAKLGGE